MLETASVMGSGDDASVREDLQMPTALKSNVRKTALDMVNARSLMVSVNVLNHTMAGTVLELDVQLTTRLNTAQGTVHVTARREYAHAHLVRIQARHVTYSNAQDS